MKIGTWNVRTMTNSVKLEEVCREMDKYDIDILGLAEIRWLEQGNHKTETGHHLLYSGEAESEQTKRQHGVGILINKAAYGSLLSWQPISNRLIMAIFQTDKGKLAIIQCYAPTNTGSSAREKDIFYNSLNKRALKSIPEDHIILVCGDFNARVGTDNSNYEQVMGTQGIEHVRTDNGNRLINLALVNKLVIGGTLFAHTADEKYTYTQKNQTRRCIRDQIDHILINQQRRALLTDVRNRREADIYTDHELLMADVQLQLCTVPLQGVGESLRELLNEQLKQHENEKWFSEETIKLIEERQKLKTLLTDAGKNSQDIRKSYNEIEERVKACAKKDKIHYNAKRALALTESAINSPQRDFRISHFEYKTQENQNKKKVYALPTRQSARLKAKNVVAVEKSETSNIDVQPDNKTEAETSVSICYQPKEEQVIDKSITEYLALVGEKKCKKNAFVNMTTTPTVQEIETALSKINMQTNFTNNNQTNMFSQYNFKKSAILTKLIQDIWHAPTEWLEFTTNELATNEPLKLLSNAVQQLLAKIIYERLVKALRDALRAEQRGYATHASCIDNVLILRTYLLRCDKPLVLLFLHFQKPYETLPQHVFWQRLSCYDIPAQLLQLIEALYVHTHGVGLCEEEWELSRFLYVLVLDDLLTRAAILCRDRDIKEHALSDLQYVDDICLLATTAQNMARKLKIIEQLAEPMGLHIDFDKSKVMYVNVESAMESYNIEQVNEFYYLGCLLRKDDSGGAVADVTNRIKKAREAYNEWKPYWLQKNEDDSKRLKIFNIIVKPVLLYGSEIWNLTRNTEAKKELKRFLKDQLNKICTSLKVNELVNAYLAEIEQYQVEWHRRVTRLEENDILRRTLDVKILN